MENETNKKIKYVHMLLAGDTQGDLLILQKETIFLGRRTYMPLRQVMQKICTHPFLIGRNYN